MHECNLCGYKWTRGVVYNTFDLSSKISYNFRYCPKCENKVKVKPRINKKIKSRAEVVKYLNSGKCYSDAQEKYPSSLWLFGKCELRCLLDFIYNGVPKNDLEKLTHL